MPNPISYPFDPTGQEQSNRIVGEQIVVTAPGSRLYHFTMPTFAPMFEEGAEFAIRDLDSNVIPLIKGVDYYFSHKFADASLATMHPLWGSITFLRRDIVGTLLATYNTLGGVWTVDYATLLQIMAQTSVNPRITTWEQVVERPIDFPVIDHPWNLDDMVGMKEIVDVLERWLGIYIDSLDPNGGGGGGAELYNHINNHNNPHGVTPALIGTLTTAEIQYLVSACLGKSETAYDSARFGGQTFVQFMQTVANSTVANATKLNNLTVAQLTTQILQGTAADSTKLAGKTLAEIMADVSNATGNATTFNGKTYEQVMEDVVDADVKKSLDSERLDGKSYAELKSDFENSVQPALAQNTTKVYGKTFEELAAAIPDAPEFKAAQDFAFAKVTADTISTPPGNTLWLPFATINHPAEVSPGVYPDLEESYLAIYLADGSAIYEARLRIGFDQILRQPNMIYSAMDLDPTVLDIGYTEELVDNEIHTTLHLKAKFPIQHIEFFQTVKGHVVLDVDESEWSFSEPDSITYANKDSNFNAAATAEFDSLASDINAGIVDPAWQ